MRNITDNWGTQTKNVPSLCHSSAAYSDKSNTCYSIQLEGVLNLLELTQHGGIVLSHRKEN